MTASCLTAAVLLAALPAAPATAPAAPAAGDREEMLARAVLADPMDAEVRGELQRLRDAQRKAFAEALAALCQGLRLYLHAGPETARPLLARAAAVPRVRALAEPLGPAVRRLLVPQAGSPPARPHRPCPKCGDTGLADCTAPRCYGSGWVPCEACRGTGTVQGKAPGGKTVLYLCRTCLGAGVVRCRTCAGHGTIQCKACDNRPGRWADDHLTGAEARAVEKVVARARWLGLGGIDLYGDEALKPSPKSR